MTQEGVPDGRKHLQVVRFLQCKRLRFPIYVEKKQWFVVYLSIIHKRMDEECTDDSEIDNISRSSSSTVQNSDQEDSELFEDVSGSSYQPYAYEPLAESSDENEQDEVDIDGICLQDIQDRYESIQTLDQWCCCGHCNTDLLCSPREYRCCHEINVANVFRLEATLKERVQCVTEHDDFDAVILHPRVLQVAANGLKTRQGRRYRKLSNDENSFYRAVAYRLFISMVFGFMGYDNSRPLPACAYTKIRTTFPKDKNTGYTGYKSAEER